MHNGRVTDDDVKTLIERFDVHLERVDQHMLRQEQHVLRQEQVIADNSRAMETLTTTLTAVVESFQAEMSKLGRRLDDMGDQIRANTRAVLTVLDRLDGPGRAA